MATDARANRPDQRLLLDDLAIARRLTIVGFGAEDGARIASVRPVVEAAVEDLATTFFSHLSSLSEASGLVHDADLLAEAGALKRAHLRAMVSGRYDKSYADQRLRLGRLYARARVEPAVFLGAFRVLLSAMSARILEARPELDSCRAIASLEKVGAFDIGLIVDAIVFEREQVIRRQEEAIRELSTPILRIRTGLVVLPVIGTVDSGRERQLTEQLLDGIHRERARVAVIDVTGVPEIDTHFANHLVQTATAARVMGARAIVTGISPSVAQTLALLGLDLGQLETAGDLQAGIEEAERFLEE